MSPSADASPGVLPSLPRLLMQRAAGLGALVLLLALALGLLRMNDDIGDEVDAAMALASAVATLGGLPQADDGQALAALAALAAQQQAAPLRHLRLQVQAADGRVLLPAAAPAAAPWWQRGLLALHRRWLSAPEHRQVQWSVPRPGGPAWTVTLAASHEAERREALGTLAGVLALLLAAVAALLLVLRWNLRHALAPLGRLLGAISGLPAQGPAAVQALPAMPVHELESVAAALRHLGSALAAAEARRRLLSQQLQTLQDDERARLARELHDEFGQHLTALRVDAAWLARQVADQPALRTVVDGMAAQCAQVQDQIRSLLTRLQPFGPAATGEPVAAGAPAAAGAAPARDSLARGAALLQALVASWRADSSASKRPLCTLQLQWLDADGGLLDWTGAPAEQCALPRPLWLTLYRISQEALTNSARHAGASRVALQLVLRGGGQPGEAVQIDWQVQDDGCGLDDTAAAMARGNGLAGLQARVWAQGAQLQLVPAAPGDAQRPGLCLRASFDSRLLPA